MAIQVQNMFCAITIETLNVNYVLNETIFRKKILTLLIRIFVHPVEIQLTRKMRRINVMACQWLSRCYPKKINILIHVYWAISCSNKGLINEGY